jgi:hypothetical protein
MAAGAGKCVEGGKLTPSRNLALDLAAAAGKLCVKSQISLFEKNVEICYFSSYPPPPRSLLQADCSTRTPQPEQSVYVAQQFKQRRVYKNYLN